MRSATASNISVVQDAGRTVPARVNTVAAAPPMSAESWAQGGNSSSGSSAKNGAAGRRAALMGGAGLWVTAVCLVLMLCQQLL
jgi:hypothetical protein